MKALSRVGVAFHVNWRRVVGFKRARHVYIGGRRAQNGIGWLCRVVVERCVQARCAHVQAHRAIVYRLCKSASERVACCSKRAARFLNLKNCVQIAPTLSSGPVICKEEVLLVLGVCKTNFQWSLTL